jgi:hypothetical protein
MTLAERMDIFRLLYVERRKPSAMTAVCSVEMEALVRKKYPDVRMPVYLVFEFEDPEIPQPKLGHIPPLEIK